MTESINDLKQLCTAYAVECKELGAGHYRLSGKGGYLDYWPTSKNRTVFFKGETIKHCSNWDALKLLLHGGQKALKPKKRHLSKERPQVDLAPKRTGAHNKHLYSGKRPPWEYPTLIRCWPDIYRGEAKKLIEQAEQMECREAYEDAEIEKPPKGGILPERR